MKKVLLYIPRWHPSMGGMETHVSNLIHHLEGYEFELLTNAIPGHPDTEKSGRITIRRIGPDDRNIVPIGKGAVHKMTFPVRYITDKTRLDNIQDIISQEDYDLLHVHYPYLPHTFSKLSVIKEKTVKKDMLLFKSSKPTVLTVHGIISRMNKEPVYAEYEEHIFKNYKNIICVDKIVEAHIKSLSGKPRTWFIPNSIDTGLFKMCDMVLSEELKVGFIGRLEHSRGIDLLEQLMSALPDYVEMHVIVSGEARKVEAFKDKFSNTNIHIRWSLDNAKLPGFIHGFDVLFNPVLAEGISRISLESMACGRPVIMLDKGNRYPVKHNETGFLVKPEIDSILDQLEEIKAHKEQLVDMGKRARQAVEKEFSNENIIPKIEEVYRTVMEET